MSTDPCPRCQGKGVIVRRDFWIKGGTGRARYTECLCPICKGSGRVTEARPRALPNDDSPF